MKATRGQENSRGPALLRQLLGHGGAQAGPRKALWRQCGKKHNVDRLLRDGIVALRAAVETEEPPRSLVLTVSAPGIDTPQNLLVCASHAPTGSEAVVRVARKLLRSLVIAVVLLTVLLVVVERWQDRRPRFAPMAQPAHGSPAFRLYRDAVASLTRREELHTACTLLASRYSCDQIRANSLAPRAVITSPPGPGAPSTAPLDTLELASLQANSRALAMLREEFKQRYAEPYARETPRATDYYQGYIELAWLLALEADHRFRTGHSAEGVASALDAVRLGITCQRGAPTIGCLAGMASEQVGRALLWAHLDRLSARDARHAALLLEELEAARPDVAEAYRRSADIAARLFIERSENPLWRWHILDQEREEIGAAERFAVFLLSLPHSRQSVLDAIHRRATASIDFAQQPYPKFYTESAVAGLWDPSLVGGVWWPDAGAVQLRHDVSRADTVLLATSLALRAYRLEHGQMPQSLGQLVSAGCLRRVPQDPFALGPQRQQSAALRYVWAAGRAVLYSIGPDASDNGGVPIQNAYRFSEHAVHPGARGDIVAGINTTCATEK